MFYQDLPDWKRPSHTIKTVYAGNDLNKMITSIYKFMHDHLYHRDPDDAGPLIKLFYDRQQQTPDKKILYEDIIKFEDVLIHEYEKYYGDMYYENSGAFSIEKWNGENLVPFFK